MNSIVAQLSFSVCEVLIGDAVVEKCANAKCRVIHRGSEGKLYRLDIDLGSAHGPDERRIEYLWLCDRCAKTLHPTVEVADKTVTLRLVETRVGMDTQPIPSPRPANPIVRPQ